MTAATNTGAASAGGQKIYVRIEDKAPAPLGAYSHAVKAGPFVYTCGLGARHPETGAEVGLTLNENGGILRYDVAAQTRQVLENLITVLAETDCTLRDVVEVTVFLAQMQDFEEYNRVYGEYFNFEHLPVRTTVQALPPGRNFIEIKAVAYKP
jgi:reactive intermediate/imine deaminase